MKSSIQLGRGESITFEPQGAGVRVTFKTMVMTFIRDLSCDQAAALGFANEKALEAADCAQQRREAKEAADSLQARQTALLTSLAPDVPF